MPRYCFTAQIEPRCIDEYKRRHAAVWPEMLEALRDAGWRNYSLFLSDAGMLVGYFEADDKDAAHARMAATAVNARWQAEMAGLFAGTRTANPDAEFQYLPIVFNLAEQLQSHGLPTD